MEEAIGFIGLGAMGFEMAMNIRKKTPSSTALYITDVNASACSKFVSQFSSYGAIHIVSTAREVAEHATALVSIVPAAEHVKSVYLDENTGVLAASLNEERLMLECSTIDPQSTRDIGNKLYETGHGVYIDTPVSGGVPGAAAGTLTFIIGHTPPAKPPSRLSSRLDTLMSLMGASAKFFYCGQLGAGLVAKITNNYLSGVHLLAAAEACNFGLRLGIDKKILYDVIHASTGQSFMFDNVHPVPGVIGHAPSSRGYEGGFKAQMMVKDMSLGVMAAEMVGGRAETGKAALALYKEAAVDERCIDRDVSVVYRFLGGPE